MSKTESIGVALDDEARARIDLMESEGYDFGPRFSKTDWTVVTVVLAACVIAIIAI